MIRILCCKLVSLLYTLFEKSNFCPKIQFWQNPNTFTSFSPKFFFWQFFSWNQSCQQLNSPKSQHFQEFFNRNKLDNFLRKSKLNFLDKKWRFRTVWVDNHSKIRLFKTFSEIPDGLFWTWNEKWAQEVSKFRIFIFK